MVLTTWYKRFCKKYQKLLLHLMPISFKDGAYYVVVATCDCRVCNRANRYSSVLYRDRLEDTHRTADMFDSTWEAYTWFQEGREMNILVWVPFIEEVQEAILARGITLSREERWANNLFAALEVLLTHATVPADLEEDRVNAIKKLKKKAMYLPKEG